MADVPHIPDEAETRARWGGFALSEANAPQARLLIAWYPAKTQFVEVER